jgi:hypothetical protein
VKSQRAHPAAALPSAAGFLFDSHAPGGGGGTGVAFDWGRIPTGLHRPFLLAGGLNPENVYDAVLATLPWGVDVSSGIELEPGIKDGYRMRTFVEEVRRAGCTVRSGPGGCGVTLPELASDPAAGRRRAHRPAIRPRQHPEAAGGGKSHGATSRPAARSSATSGSGAIAGPSPATAASSR